MGLLGDKGHAKGSFTATMGVEFICHLSLGFLGLSQ